MKKLLVVLAILFVGILLAGCTSSSQPAETPVATTVVPVVVPTTIANLSVPTAQPTQEVIVIIANKTANVTATPTPVPTYLITFTQDLTISPSASAMIKVGTKVVWSNTDPFKPHTLQANNIQTGAYFGGMSPVTVPYGGTYEVTFDKVGGYDYTTGPFQPQEQGKISVVA
jgi:plastocyanin